MAVRRPLYVTGGNLREMSDVFIGNLHVHMLYEYIKNPSVTLSVVPSGGNLGDIYDYRLVAGQTWSGTAEFPPETSTPEPFYTRDTYNRVLMETSATTAPTDTDSIAYPCYYNSNGNIQSMSLLDMYDTFVSPAIDLIIENLVYYVSTSSDITGFTNLGMIHTDTTTNLAAYTASEIPEAQDQSTVVTTTYLFKRNNPTETYFGYWPVKIDSSGNIAEFNYGTILADLVRYAATSVSPYRLTYNINGAGTPIGSSLTDTYLAGGAGNYQQFFAGADDYRAQEFPDGTNTSAYFTIKINKY